MANPHPRRARWRTTFRLPAVGRRSNEIMIGGRRLRVEHASVLGKRKRLIRLPDNMSTEELHVVKTMLVAVGGRWSSWRKGFVFDNDPTAAILQAMVGALPVSPHARGCQDHLALAAVAGYSSIPVTEGPLRVLMAEIDDGALVRAALDLGGEHIRVTTTAPKHRPRSAMPADPRLRVFPGTLTALLGTRPAPFDEALALVKHGVSSTDLVRQLWEHVVPGGRVIMLVLDVADAERRELYAMAARYGAHRALRSKGNSTSLRAVVVWMVRPGGRARHTASGRKGNRG
ncbi:hypothetical protein [Amycolatopsis sp. NBC_01480]|uniref:hypothetical protein n=1 Tax=Amycolatopsis sp. NBC_01480 TaxID=2903562 RepID=UPI002E280EF6|nr:hypothetical protein [Amycolatopsis sp. NBC_01480]